jgi:hypothetical protein
MSTAPSAKKNLGWLWYYLTLIVLAVSATVILIVYNEGQQLRAEQLATARLHWREKGPANYRMIYNIKVYDSPSEFHVDHFDVTVRGGVVSAATKKGKTEPADRLGLYGMDKLLAFIADNMDNDQEPGRPRTFTRALFEPNNGALFWYVRRVMGSHERVEISIEKIE